MIWHDSWLILFLAGSRHFESWMFETFSLQCQVWGFCEYTGGTVRYGVLQGKSCLQQATVTVRSTLKRTFLEPSVAESLGERLYTTLPVAAVESGSAAFT